MTKEFYGTVCSRKSIFSFILLIFAMGITSSFAQSQQLKSLRSDVGIIGLTANFKWLSDFEYKGNKALQDDNTTELEFKLRDVRTISPHAGVGFQILTSFYTGNSSFGIGSWGLGPVLRGYPFDTDKWQPYAQGEMLFGNNMAVGELADTQTGGNGFRVRLGLRGGLAYRINNDLGFFIEAGPDWESSRVFKSDARTLQINFGIDVYRFN